LVRAGVDAGGGFEAELFLAELLCLQGRAEEAEEVLRYWNLAVNGNHRIAAGQARWLVAAAALAGVLGGVLLRRRAH
jgi:hypothetical protein